MPPLTPPPLFSAHNDCCCEGQTSKKQSRGVLICRSQSHLPACHHRAQYYLPQCPHHWHHSYCLQVNICQKRQHFKFRNFINRIKKRRMETVYIPSQPCSSRCDECSNEGSLLRSARDLAIMTRDSSLNSC